MTLRALILGFVGALFIASVGFLNDWVFKLTMIAGNHFPISVFGLILVVVLTVNPLLRVLRSGWRLGSSELAVIMMMMLVACSIPGSGLMRTFMPTLALPIRVNDGDSGWKKNNVLAMCPPQLLANDGRTGKAIDDFVAGKRQPGRSIGLEEVPWQGWVKPLEVWVPLVFMLGLAMITMALIVHRQWGYRERLRYPIAEVAKAIISQDDHSFGPMFRNKGFWLGLLAVFAIHVVNGWYALSQQSSIKIPLTFDFSAINQAYPALARTEGGHYLTSPTLYPTVVAFAFFLASDVGLSLGLSQPFFVALLIMATKFNVDVSRDWVTGGAPDYQRFGSYLGIAILLLYMGRRYYWDMLQAAVLPWIKRSVEPASVWACRFFLLSLAGVIGILIGMGLDWPIAVLATLLIMLIMLVMSRISAEAGLFFNQPWWQPLGILFGLLGATALGPKAIIIVGMVVMIMIIDPRESLMPYIINGLKICDDMKVKPSRVGWSATATFAAGLAISVPVVLWSCYNYGSPDDGWGKQLAKWPFAQASKTTDQLRIKDELANSMSMQGFDRIANARPDSRFLWAGSAGLVLVLVVSLLRLRFTWWPLHPIIFLVWGTFPMWHFSSSFMLGWVIKGLVTRLGGGARYRQTIPLMLGVIAGDILGGLLWSVHGAAYFAINDSTLPAAQSYKILPG